LAIPIIRDTAYFRQMVTPSQDINNSYINLWWLNGSKSHMMTKTQVVFPGWLCPNAPADMIAALGKDGQLLNVVPGMGLVVGRMGRDPDDPSLVPNRLNDQVWKRLNEVLRRTTGVDMEQSERTEKPGDFSVQFFPSPARESVTVRSAQETGVRITDALGRQMWRAPVQGSSTVCTAHWSPGLYIVRTDIGARRFS
jgi:hypothetical protein